MEITGTGFGSDSSITHVHLSNSSGKVYEMKILDQNDTYIKCGIPGGLPGQFDVVVSIDGSGDVPASPTTANDFVYELVIDSVSPTTGGYNGGTLITITGRNFSPEKAETLLHISGQINWLCDLETVTTTQIQCRTPPYHEDWGNQTTHAVSLTNKLMVESNCSSTCDFTYGPESDAMSISSLSLTSAKKADSIEITGTNFDISGSALKVIVENKLTGDKTEVTPSASTATSVTFAVPAVMAGAYSVRTRVDPSGESNSAALEIKSNVSPSSASFSVHGGDVTISGRGFPSSWPSTLFSLSMSSNSFPMNVEVVSTT